MRGIVGVVYTLTNHIAGYHVIETIISPSDDIKTAMYICTSYMYCLTSWRLLHVYHSTESTTSAAMETVARAGHVLVVKLENNSALSCLGQRQLLEEGREPDRLYVATVGQLNGDYLYYRCTCTFHFHP